MSIKNRIEDAQILYKNGRKEGALLSTLIAVAATSRKRYPRERKGIKAKENSDKYVFRLFVSEEMSKRGPGWSEDNPLPITFQDEKLLLPEVLYRCVRNELVHEAKLPEYIAFESGDGMRITILNNKKITFTDGIIFNLAKIVVEAPENNDLFKRK